MLNVVNIIAIIVSPIVAVWVTQRLQVRAEKREDRSKIFRTLMTYRGIDWTNWECVNSLNMIEVVFYDDKDVVSRWKDLLDKYSSGQIELADYSKILTAKDKLLEAMAKSLGYSNQIDWDTIQHPYVPKWISDNNMKQSELLELQLNIGKTLSSVMGQPAAQSDQQSATSEQ
ncbi:DUF6680 family protein [Adlercreutzia caecimuris]|uniref:DUF6680 domain-containing protein n=1 Tax=Adlercreutzia caecimuris B7 TaxID=1235794 RepID=R9L303_9ACTN|nr:DUF6680 family protein [Adlercreutzia caecimuris]EOS52898.1 hypothetical protein C811_00181 [Adlercreutzia caecimuris B7]